MIQQPLDILYMEDGTVHHIPAQKINKAINPTGAGDSFNAGVIAASSKGLGLRDAVAFGCGVAAAKITAADLPTIE
jgi:sugar/nucleoside kinase (ribokinase family)